MAAEIANSTAGRLVVAVEKLNEEVPALKGSIDRMETALTATQERTEKVDSQRRRWVFPLAIALVLVTAFALFSWHQQRVTNGQFQKVRQALIDSCQARQRSDAGLRARDEALLADARQRVTSLSAATAPGGQSTILAVLVSSARADVTAYELSVAAVPKPANCEARYSLK